ncbi:hypothetical protein OEZ85_008128 [Tetradesmus obliquus]|uniref:Uncharacterized protein n=1 Tax=Tetradesmus obliquus TaxID=3088 RepID=A0ABY8TIG8_TETOB|nr:hypothetical protein OEZ85_008128 [Tetradesmus obliquus]
MGLTLTLYEHIAQDRLVAAFIQDVLASLSIPHAELEKLAASELSDAALTAWALTKTASHPAVQQAAAASQRLQALLAKLDGAMMWQQQAAGSPLGQLLWQVAVGAAGSEVASLSAEQLQGRLEYQVVAALARDAAPQQAKQLLQELLGQLHQLTDTPALAAVSHPAFWQLAQQASAGSLPLAQDLQLLGYDLAAAASSAAGELQQLQQLLALDASELQQQLLRSGRLDASLLQPGRMKELLAAVAGDAAARQAVAGLQLLQVLGQALGLSSVQLCSPVSACDLLARLTGRQQQPRELAQGLQQQLSAAAPQLLAAVQQLPAAALEQATVGSLLQLLSSKPKLQDLATSLTAWRAEAAAAGHLPVLTSLSQAEVSGLSGPQAEGLARAMMRLEARGSLLLRKAAARALQLGQLDAGDAAALAWKVHTGGAAAAEEVVRVLLQQAAAEYSAALHELGGAEAALSHMAAGFQLEEATSRRSSAAPPSALLLAVAQHTVEHWQLSSSRHADYEDEEEETAGLYEMLADVHADVDVQRYLQMEFDPALEVDVVHAPLGWQAPDLFTAPGYFLDGMRPLLDAYLAAQGQQPTHDLEWQVYRDAALAEHEQVEIAADAARRAAGHSPFHNSRADEAYLLQRVDAAIPQDSVLYAAAHKYLRATFKNRSWTFAQRKRLVDRLAGIAGHLAAHPPRSHRGSPFSALFQPDGPPAAPRLPRDGGAAAGGGPKGDAEAYVLPAGFGARL